MQAASSRHLPVARVAPASVRTISTARIFVAGRSRRESLGLSIPLSRVRREGLTVFEGGVYDLRRFAARHPGGQVLQAVVGTDASLALLNAHGKSVAVRHMLKRFHVGAFAEATRDPLERDLLALRADFTREGLFTYPRARLVLDVVRWLTLFGAGIALASRSASAAFVLVLVATIDVVWWIHDAGHDAVFADEARARQVIDLLGVLVLGMPQVDYHYGVHRRHHGFPNVLGLDEALDTGPVAWTEETAASKSPFARNNRVALWFLAIVPFAGVALTWSAIVAAARKRRRLVVLLVVLRWILVGAFAVHVGAPALVLAPWIAGSVLAFMAGLNHFHLPITAVADPSYARAVFERTQNVDHAGRLWHWLSGGLDLHIEHHLFPSLPSFRYRGVAPRIRQLAARHRVPYRVTTKRGAIANLVRALSSPLRRLAVDT